MFGPKGPICQSCGMPLSKDKEDSGNSLYCSHCFQNGKFAQPNLTVNEMQELVKGKLQKMHFPGFIADMFTKNIPSLKRWRGN